MKNIFLTILLFCVVFSVKAQDPNWSVDTSKYQYSMTFTTFLNVDGVTLSSPEDKVAAIVNDEVRGVANVVYVANVNKYVAYLTVYANTNGEALNFKIFRDSDETVHDVSKTENFIIDGNLGGIFQSYSIASPTLSNEAVLNSFAFSGVTAVSQTINNNRIDVVLPKDTNLTNLIATYSISNGARFFVDNVKQVSGTTINDFSTTITYQMLSENEAVLISYQVSVKIENKDIAIPEIVLTSISNTFVKQAPILINLETTVAISSFSLEDILLTNAVIASIIKTDDLQYSIEIVPIKQGDFSIQIPKDVVVNTENEGNLVSNKLSFTYDILKPYIVSIKRKNPTVEITNSEILEFKVVFSEAVENVFSTDFISITDAKFLVQKENETTYTVTVSNIKNYTGAVSINLKSTNTIQDKAGNLLLNSVINVSQN